MTAIIEQNDELNKIEYNKMRNRERAARHYQKKLNEDPTYRDKLNTKTKNIYYKKKMESEEPTRPRGRPRIHELKEKKVNGRPRKYIL